MTQGIQIGRRAAFAHAGCGVIGRVGGVIGDHDAVQAAQVKHVARAAIGRIGQVFAGLAARQKDRAVPGQGAVDGKDIIARAAKGLIPGADDQIVIVQAAIEGIRAFAADQGIGACAADEAVIARAASQAVVVVAALQRIGTIAAGDAVIAVAACDDVIAAARGHGVIARTGRDHVIARAGGDAVIASASIKVDWAGRPAAADGVAARAGEDAFDFGEGDVGAAVGVQPVDGARLGVGGQGDQNRCRDAR